jgi:hypothetical protein
MEKESEVSTIKVDDLDEDDEFDRDVEEEDSLSKEISNIEVPKEGSSLEDDDENNMENVDESTEGDAGGNKSTMNNKI